MGNENIIIRSNQSVSLTFDLLALLLCKQSPVSLRLCTPQLIHTVIWWLWRVIVDVAHFALVKHQRLLKVSPA